MAIGENKYKQAKRIRWKQIQIQIQIRNPKSNSNFILENGIDNNGKRDLNFNVPVLGWNQCAHTQRLHRKRKSQSYFTRIYVYIVYGVYTYRNTPELVYMQWRTISYQRLISNTTTKNFWPARERVAHSATTSKTSENTVTPFVLIRVYFTLWRRAPFHHFASIQYFLHGVSNAAIILVPFVRMRSVGIARMFLSVASALFGYLNLLHTPCTHTLCSE